MPLTRRQFVRTLFVATQATLATRFLDSKLWAADSALSFLLVGDWGRRGDPNQIQVSKQMGLFAARTNASFVISTGDNFYNDGVTSVTDSHWKESFESIYTAQSLQVPWYVVLGNHDYRGNVQAQLDYSHSDRRWNMPSRYFKKQFAVPSGAKLDIFFLDTNLLLNNSKTHSPAYPEECAAQLAWVSEELARSTASWKMVVGHHPIFSGGEHGNSPELIERLVPVLKKNHVDIYCNGHDHDLQHLRAAGIEFFCSGGGSQIRDTKAIAQTRFAKSSAGFMGVQLSSSEMQVQMFNNLGEVLYATTLKKQHALAS